MTAIVIPTLGGRHLDSCLDAVAALETAPETTVVVISGGAAPSRRSGDVEFRAVRTRLGFSAAANLGIRQVADTADRIALLNDDATPAPGWLAPLEEALDTDSSLAAVQGTVTDADGSTVDGRGISLDPWGLPIQIGRGGAPDPEPRRPRPLIAVSATAALYRADALRATIFDNGEVFDSRFGSYHEDLDLGLRMRRLGWNAAWVPGAHAAHVGSASGRRSGWRHPWWLLTNRWRALAGNLTATALFTLLPRLLRGEIRAFRTLARENPRTTLTALASTTALPWLLARGLGRRTPGPRLEALPVEEP
jgi:GT2 family glycosyltransferase